MKLATLLRAHSFSGSALTAITVRCLSILSGLVFTSVLSFWLAKVEYGAVVTALSTALFVSTIGEFGQRELMAREISRALAYDDSARARTLALWSLGIITLTGLASAAVVFILMTVSGFGTGLALATALITYALCFDGALAGIGRAFGQVFWALAPRDFIWRTAAMSIVVGLLAVGLPVGASLTGVILFLSMIASSALQIVALAPQARKLPKDPSGYPSDKTQLLKSSIDIGIGYVGGVILATLDVVIVGMLLGPNAAAEYYPANRIAILALSLPITLQVLFPSSFARLFAQGRLDHIRTMARGGALFSAGGTLIGYVLIMLSRPFLPLLFDTATDQTWLMTVILSTGSLLNATCGFAGSILVATGHESVIRRITLFTVPLTAAALVVVALLGGQIAVAVAVSVISTLRLLAIAYACHRKFGFAGSILV